MDSVFSTRLMARAGFPWLCVDMEHSAFDWALASTMFGFIAEAGCVPLCRVPNGTHENIKRALDAGAWGIVAPMVDTVRRPAIVAPRTCFNIPLLQAEQARAIVAACKYPPQGNRSGESRAALPSQSMTARNRPPLPAVGSGSHYLSLGTTDAYYKEHANDEILVILQTEVRAAAPLQTSA